VIYRVRAQIALFWASYRIGINPLLST